MSRRLEGKVAIVTGAASGIGRATAVRFAAEGAKVLAADIDAAGAEAVAEAIVAAGGEACSETGDVARREDCEATVAAAVERYGRLDALVNAAGITPRNLGGPEVDVVEAWNRVMAVNLKGSMLMCHAAIPHMRHGGGGSIVNLASVMGVVVAHDDLGLSDGFNPYPQSKGGVVQLTRDIGVAFAKSGIRANAVCPGFVHTGLTAGITENPELLEKLEYFHPIGRLGQPEEIASVVLFLASDEASFVNAAAWMVDGGYTAV